ncbi:hypothetical protein WICMUC_002011 [Wickerhamomyces mucosus]|uniref:SPS-sensor serine protease component SSY5 n=1 Tax=Wickerhamomyces mucosus TaxID=1378264 RepID=A0A9P8PRR5_9ASCO|nr:hypothetical protein WICMUC_002011 [Wickerhamomyces mucosus]
MRNFFKKQKDKESVSKLHSNNPSVRNDNQSLTLSSSTNDVIDYDAGEELDQIKSLQQSSFSNKNDHNNHTFSLFSNQHTFSTNPSSFLSKDSISGYNNSQIDNIGKPLRVINSDRYNELTRTGTGNSSILSNNFNLKNRRKSDNNLEKIDQDLEKITKDHLESELKLLNDNLLELNEQVNQNILNISKASIKLIEIFDGFLPNFIQIQIIDDINSINFNTNLNLRNITKIFLQFYDNLLVSEVYLNSKKLLIQSFKKFLMKFNFEISQFQEFQYQPLLFINNFAITSECKFNNKILIGNIIDTIMENSSTNQMIQDQQGSFIAPILRGFSKSTSILSIMFGFPEPQLDHYEIINALFELFPDVHFFVVKNSIQPCGYKFNQPFKLPTLNKPEISISISSENSSKISGTLGGYIKPKLNLIDDEIKFNRYKDSKFALTCGHVLLNSKKDLNSKVFIPSKILIEAYKSALIDQRDKYSPDSMEFKSYDLEICKKFETELGSIIWGERILLEKQISDLAIVKINDNFHVEFNYAGDLDQFNPSLKFKNSHIVRKIPKENFVKLFKVFKIGASTNYTQGEINEFKLIYWNDGNLQTSEFIVSNLNKNTTFANFGDSGSLILNDLSNEIGLGCLGMLHSFDGEFKQFGLFTPIDDIFNRLKDVTGVEWDFIYERN